MCESISTLTRKLAHVSVYCCLGSKTRQSSPKIHTWNIYVQQPYPAYPPTHIYIYIYFKAEPETSIITIAGLNLYCGSIRHKSRMARKTRITILCFAHLRTMLFTCCNFSHNCFLTFKLKTIPLEEFSGWKIMYSSVACLEHMKLWFHFTVAFLERSQTCWIPFVAPTAQINIANSTYLLHCTLCTLRINSIKSIPKKISLLMLTW